MVDFSLTERKMEHLLWMICASVIVVGGTVIFLRTIKHRKFPKKAPPGPSLVQGINIFIKGSRENKLHLYLPEWAKKYGDIMQVNMLLRKVVFINDADVYRRLVNGADFRDFTNDRPPTFFAKYYIGGNKDIVFAPSDHELQEKRKIFYTILQLYSQDAGIFKQLMISSLTELIQTFKNMETVDLSVCLKKYVLKLTSFLFTGNLTEAAQKYETVLEAYTYSVTKAFLFENETYLQPLPFLRFIPGLRFRQLHKAMIAARQELHEVYWYSMKETFQKNRRRGMVDELIVIQQNMTKEGGRFRFDDETIKTLIQDVAAAGYLTTSSTLACLFLHLIKYPQIQARLYEEIKNTIGESSPRPEHRSNMPYTEAVILETLRFSSTAPLLVPHCTTKDIIFQEYFIPKGTILIMNAWYNHHREDFWDDPYTFRPDRFMTPNGQLKDKADPVRTKLIPFGSGRRSCPGETFAKSRIFLITVYLIRAYQILLNGQALLPSSDPRDWVGEATLRPDNFSCLVKSRDNQTEKNI